MANPSPKPGPGRPKGSVNKLTKDIKEAVIAAFDKAGGIEYLVTQSRENPQAFMSLIGRIIPTQLNGKLDGKLKVIVETGVPRD